MDRRKNPVDWIVVVIILGLSVFGLFLLLTVDPGLLTQQLAFLVAGIILLFVSSRVDRELLVWFAPWSYILGIVLLLLSYAGPAIRGAHRWFFIGPIQLQPSELMKPFFLLAFSYFISRFPPREIKYLPLHTGLFLLPFLLVFRQPDLGTGLVYIGFWLSMLLAGGMPIFLAVLGLIILGLLVPFIWRALADFQKNRILTFLNPGVDPRGAGYNALQSMIAVGSGQIFGRGLGRGTQSHLRFLPEFHTDFIFATLVEELGFFGGLALLVGYGMLLWRIISPLVRGFIDDSWAFIYTIGLFGMMLAQIFINAGMNMGILPITGITLPFVSYGGSSLLSLCLSFGLLWAIRTTRGIR